jgi:hypothetical protein
MPNVGLDDTMRSLVYPGLLGISGTACLLVVGIVSRFEGNIVSPAECRFLLVLCWFSLGVGAIGAAWALALRIRAARKEMSTLVVSLCFAVVAGSVWARVALLPRYVGVPMTVPFKKQGANKIPEPTRDSALGELTPTAWKIDRVKKS